jgi:hypothetical protein
VLSAGAQDRETSPTFRGGDRTFPYGEWVATEDLANKNFIVLRGRKQSRQIGGHVCA